ncbi:MAG: hypothetical protein PHY73_03870 [Candidatus Omnitrophica bacterium]|nr:hypothetical protein [Candidatus Omnitrophota bacterium]
MKKKLFIFILVFVIGFLFRASTVFSQNQTSVSSLADYWAQSVSELKVSMDKLSEQNDSVLLENKQLAEDLKYLLEQVKKTNEQIENLSVKDTVTLQTMENDQAEVFRLEKVLSELIKRKTDFEQKANKLGDDIEKKEKQNEQMGIKINQLKEDIRSLEEERKFGKKEYQQVSSDYVTQKARLAQLIETSQEDCKVWKKKIESLNEEILSFRERFQKLNNENKKIYSEMSNIYEDILVLLSKQDSLKNEHVVALDQYQKESGIFLSKIAQLEGQKQELQNSLAAIEDRNRSLKQHIGTEKIEILRSEALKLEEENKDLQIELKKLKKNLSKSQKQTQQIESLIKSY